MKYSFLVWLLILVFNCDIFAQKVLEYQNVEADTVKKKYGANYRHYVFVYNEFGLLGGTPETKEAEVKSSSFFWALGLRYKLKLNQTFSIVTGIGYNSSRYNMVQDTTPRLPHFTSGTLFSKELLVFRDLKIDGMLRINLEGKKRGNSVGKYIDLGAYLSWMAQMRHIVESDFVGLDPLFQASSQRTVNTGMVYPEDFIYGFQARMGWKNASVFAQYRISDRFQSGFNLPELPRLTIGLSLNAGS